MAERSEDEAELKPFLDKWHFTPGELKLNLESGKYEVRIDATEYERSETIALQVTAPSTARQT